MADDTPNPEHPAGLPATPSEAPPPKPYRVRHDGWTVERQNKFIDVLGRTGCVRDAARMAGISWNSAYKFRERDANFDERWQSALRRAKTPLGEVAWKRAVEGEKQDVWYHGKVVGQRVKHANDVLRLLIQRDDNGAGRDAQGRFAPAGVDGNGAGADAKGVDGRVIEGKVYNRDDDPEVDGPTMINGRQVYPKWLTIEKPGPGEPRDTLDEKLKKISGRIGEIGTRHINVRTNQGITDEIIDLVQRFIEGGRVMLPERLKWLDADAFERAKAEFLAEYPGGVPEDRMEEFAKE